LEQLCFTQILPDLNHETWHQCLQNHLLLPSSLMLLLSLSLLLLLLPLSLLLLLSLSLLLLLSLSLLLLLLLLLPLFLLQVWPLPSPPLASNGTSPTAGRHCSTCWSKGPAGLAARRESSLPRNWLTPGSGGGKVHISKASREMQPALNEVTHFIESCILYRVASATRYEMLNK
jgi:hypothetical protein